MFWGFSESLDLFAEFQSQVKNVVNEPSEINILLFGSGDPRHILKTVAKSYKHKVKCNFYVIDGFLPAIARNMLLLSIALEPPELISIKTKTQLFMDVYGNSFMRASSYGYVWSKANHFLRCITDLEYGKEMQPIFKLDQLKYAERDELVSIIEFWRHKPKYIFDIRCHWNDRVRQYLGQRYDSRFGAFDWDLNMRLKDYGGQQICGQEYKHWRDTGIAFTFPEFEQSYPNKTFAVGLQQNGSNYQHKGYVGDILVGPYCAFGLTCDNSEMLKSYYGNNEFRATDITEHNIYEIFYEITNRQPCIKFETDEHKYGSAILGLGKILDTVDSHAKEDDLKKYNRKLLATNNATVTFLSMECVLKLHEKKEFTKFFHVCFVAHNYFTLFKSDFTTVLAEKAIVLFETKQMSVLRKEKISEFLKQIKTAAKDLNLNAISNFNVNLPLSVAKFKTF